MTATLALLLLACAGSATLASGAEGASPSATPPPAPGTLPVQADLHLDTPTQLHRRKVGLDAPNLEAGLAQLRAGGTNLAVMALWPPRTVDWEAHVDALLTRMEAEDARLDEVVLVRSPAEARAAAAAGRVGIVYALEGAHGIDRSGIVGLERLHARGLALLGLTWTFDTRWAGSSGGAGSGLTREGRTLVDAANRLGVLLDVSHASRATTLEVCARSRAPVVASHSDAHALTPHPRNLLDDEIRAISATGGVIGVNLHRPFLGGSGDLARAADHATYLKRIGGPGVVALGSDFDGLIVPPRDLGDAAGLGALWPLLAARGWTASEVEGLRGANFLRAWDAARAASSPATTRSSRAPD